MLLLIALGCNGDQTDPPGKTSHPESVDDAAALVHGHSSELFGLALGAVGDVAGDGTAYLAGAGIGARVCLFSAASTGSVDTEVGPCVAAESAADSFGTAIDGGADLDGSAGVEWAVGAPTAGGGASGAGAVYVFSGMPEAATDALVTIRGDEALDTFGLALRVMDADDDGNADLIVGATGADGALVADAGAAYVFFGPIAPGEHTARDAELKLEGGLPLRHIGAPGNAMAGSIGSADVNGDGVLDLVLSQGGTDIDAGTRDAGVAFLFLGPMVRGTVSAPAFADVTFLGTRQGEYASEPIDGAGDLTGDGLDDVIIAANGTTPERMAVFSGTSSGTHTLDEADVTVEPAVIGESTGWALGTGGDVDGDGAPDLLVGSPYGGSGSEGEIRILSSPIGTGTLALADQPAVVGPSPGSEFGKSIALAGDVDDDGRADFAVGLPQNDSLTGAVALFTGF